MFIRKPSCVSVNCPELYPNKSFPSMSRYQQRYILGWLFIRVGYDNLEKKSQNCLLLKKNYLKLQWNLSSGDTLGTKKSAP